MQVFGKAVGSFDAIRCNPHLLIQIHLAAVGLVRNADHVGALGEQFRVFGEFMDGGQKDTAAAPALEQFPELSPALHTDHRLVADIPLGPHKLAGKLVVQVGPVGDKHNGGAGKINALHEQPGQKKHGKGLAAAGGPEIGAALTIPPGSSMGLDIGIELDSRIVLRITAEDLLFLARGYPAGR